MFSEVRCHRAHIDTNLAILCKVAKRTDEADKYFRQARVVAENLGAKGLLAKIDAASSVSTWSGFVDLRTLLTSSTDFAYERTDLLLVR
jgi:hypothetical protein